MNYFDYINTFNDYLCQKKGTNLARLLTYQDKYHSQSDSIMNEINEELLSKYISSPFDSLAFAHLHCCFYLINQDFINAYKEQANCLQQMTKILQSMRDENWILPVLYLMARDLRLIAIGADKQNAMKNLNSTTRSSSFMPNEWLEKSADPLMGVFRVCANDVRSAMENSKRIAMMNIINQLFKIYFKINKFHLCKPLIRALENANIMHCFTLAQRVTYNYFLGMKSMFDSDYKKADELLSFSFNNCHPQSFNNKRLILIFLIPVKMLLGIMPVDILLQKYQLLQFDSVVKSVKVGNLKALEQALEENSDFFWKYGIYLILEKLKIIAYRNVFKKVCLILQTHQVPIESFKIVLEYLQEEEISLKEVNCIISNLIYEGKIKGYISLQHQKLVISKRDPFPSLASIIG